MTGGNRVSTVVRIASIAAIAGLSLSLAGCEDERDPVQAAVAEASSELVAISGAGRIKPAASYREQAFGSVASELESAVRSDGDSPSAPAAQALAAQARAGQGTAIAEQIDAEVRAVLASVRAAEADLEALDLLRRVSLLAGTFNPAEEEARARGVLARYEANLAQNSAQMDQLEAEAQQLRDQINQRLDAAREARLREASKREQALRAGPIERAELISEAVAESRAAEAQEQAAAELEVQLGAVTSNLNDAQKRATGDEAAIASIEDLLDSIESAATERSGAERSRRGEISGALESARAGFAEAERVFSESYEPRYQAAVEAFEAALRTAPRGGAADIANSVRTTSSQSLAALALRRALLAERLASLAEALDDDTSASTFREIADEAVQNAAESFESAASSARGGDRVAAASEAMQARAEALRENGLSGLGRVADSQQPAAGMGGVEAEDAGETGGSDPFGAFGAQGGDADWDDGAADEEFEGFGDFGEDDMSPAMPQGGEAGGGGMLDFLRRIGEFGKKPESSEESGDSGEEGDATDEQ
jgi:hypothetical protein